MTKTEDALMAFIQKQTEAMEKQQEKQEATMKEQQEAMREQQEAMREQEKKFLATIAKLAEGQRGNVDEDKDDFVIPKSQAAVTRQMAQLSSRIPMFKFDAEYDLTFSKWYERHGDVITVDGSELDEGNRTRLLLEKLEDDVFNKYKRQILPDGPTDMGYEDTVKMLKEMFDVKTSTFTTRYQCLKIEKSESEDLMEYTGRVNESCEKAKIHDLDSDGLKCLVWIYGLKSTKDSDIRSRMLAFLNREHGENKKVTVHELYKEAAHYISLKRDAHLIEDRHRAVHEVSARKTRHPQRQQPQAESTCWNCGKPKHRSTDCRQKKNRCGKCKKDGHMDRYCETVNRFRERSRSRDPSRHRKVASVVVIGRAESTGAVSVNAARQYIDLEINGLEIPFQIDTGSDITLLNEEQWNKMGRPSVEPSDVTVQDASGGTMVIKGRVLCNFATAKAKGCGYAYITPRMSLMGLSWISQCDDMAHYMRMMTVCMTKTKGNLEEELKSSFPQVFEEGLGRCVKEEAEMTLIDDVKPIFRPRRPVPHAAEETVDKELDRLLELKVIEPVTHSKWAAPIVCVKKANGKLRVCADFSTGLNRALVDNQYPLPLPDDIFATLNGGEVFSQIDFSDAYLQVELSESSKDLVVINTHRGLFRYNRLPFGIKTAPAIFQHIMNKMCCGLNGVACYLDDIVVVGRNEEEHRKNLLALFGRIVEYGFRVRLEKCTFMKDEIPFLGFIIDKNGRRPNPEKIRAIQVMKEPENVSQLRAFLGMVNYYGNFIPTMRGLRGPLDKLMVKDEEWKWTEVHQKSFEDLKEVLSSKLNLCHYDPTKQIIVAADACEYGIGCVLSHRFEDGTERPIYHAARSLKPAEKNYSQIEKEALGLIFAVKKFHKYIFGRKFTLLTDHKPLLAIFGSKSGVPVHSANRLMRWATMLIGYDFTIEYVNTEKFGQADGLSRMIQKYPTEKEDMVVAFVETDVVQVLQSAIRRLPTTEEDVYRGTQDDSLLRKVMKFTQQGWPKKVKADMTPFASRKDSLSVVNGCLMFGDRVVIPQELRKAVLKELHKGHPGIVRMKGLARSYIYWPGLDEDCEKTVRACTQCQEASKSPAKVPLKTWNTPDRTWQRIHVDFAGPTDGKMYMVVVDALSKWPEIHIMSSTTARATVKTLMDIFARYGLPETVVTGNGTQFTSEEFQRMCSEHGIEHLTCAPYHPQSNGQAERFVDILKRGMQKLKGEGGSAEDQLNRLLLAYRTTPIPSLNVTPSEMFLGRKLRTTLSLLLPRKVKPGDPRRDLRYKAERSFNRKHGTKLRAYKVGDRVWVKDYHGLQWTWTQAVVEKRVGSVKYAAKIGGKTTHRHANQMRIDETGADNYKEDSLWLDIMLDTFDLPAMTTRVEEAPAPDVATPAVVLPPTAIPINNGSPVASPPIQRRPPRQRRAPVRFDPTP